ncbi:Vacuolar protein sorting-associated protein 26C [Geodia barretti]|uniref:Vacuolar protein sorting-associated protein 26C n=1 Tax=Geodia barretti TaxID=519541 RepID=A0AA35TGS3_GEOBA|nr:Vacuolar protein sorting-associated protein 26C [Geodia barretti]
MATLDIRLKRANKVYREGEVIKGALVVTSKSELSHTGITLAMDGTVSLQLSAKSVGVFEAFYNSLKPINLLNYSLEISKAGKLPSGSTEIPFELPLRPKAGKKLYETYHGVFVNILYTLKVDMKRPLLNKDMQKVSEFIVEYAPGEKQEEKEVKFTISPQSLENVKDRGRVPDFLVSGKIDTVNCCITKPFCGELTVERSSSSIRSIELQLVRVETCGCAEGYARDPTEIQNIQIADGDVCKGIVIPLYMVFPRLFTSPTLATSNFKVEFEVNVVIIFHDDSLVTENFPIKLSRF